MMSLTEHMGRPSKEPKEGKLNKNLHFLICASGLPQYHFASTLKIDPNTFKDLKYCRQEFSEEQFEVLAEEFTYIFKQEITIDMLKLGGKIILDVNKFLED